MATTTDLPPPTDRPDPAAVGDRPKDSLRFTLPDSDVLIGPVGYLAGERQRLESLSWEHLDVVPCSATIGAEVSGVRLADASEGTMDQATVAEIARALREHKVLFFRDQQMSAPEHVAFARCFGELEVHPFLPANIDVPEVVRFAKSAEVGGYENGWHHDVTWRETPSKAAILHALEVPATGGDTLFSDAHAALDGLPTELRHRADGLLAVHDFAHAFGPTMSAEDLARSREQHPPVLHPVVVTHPETGRELLYVNRYFVSGLAEADGSPLDPEESRALLDALCRSFELLEHQVRLRWAPDSVAFWDNRAVQHYACSDYWPDVRVMERVSIVGDRPRRRR